MSDHIQGIAPIEQSGVQTQSLTQMTDMNGYSTQTADQTAKATRGALDVALTFPGTQSTPLDVKEGIVSGSNGTVDAAKNDLIADHTQSSSNTDSKLHDELTVKAKQLYVELGRWNVAWAVAKRIQRDSNQIMRGQ